MMERPSYLRQRQTVANGGSLVDVVDMLVTELRTDQPSAIDITRSSKPGVLA
jgi:hypothetical protein